MEIWQHEEALQAIGLKLDLDIANNNHTPYLRRLSPDEPIAIFTETDVRMMLDVLKLVFELTDATVFLEWDITNALEEVGLREYFNSGVRMLLQREREYALINLAKNNTIYELVEMGLLDSPDILAELIGLNLPNEIFESDMLMAYMDVFSIDQINSAPRYMIDNVPTNTVVTRLNVWQGRTMFGSGQVIDYALSIFLEPQSPTTLGHLEIGTTIPFMGVNSFMNNAVVTVTPDQQVRMGTFIPRRYADLVVALRAPSGNNVRVMWGNFTIWQ